MRCWLSGRLRRLRLTPAPHLRALLPERCVGDRLQRLVEVPELVRKPQRGLARIEPAIDAADFIGQARIASSSRSSRSLRGSVTAVIVAKLPSGIDRLRIVIA